MTLLQRFFVLLWIPIVLAGVPVIAYMLVGELRPSVIAPHVLDMMKMLPLWFLHLPELYFARLPQTTYWGECTHVIRGVLPATICYTITFTWLVITFVRWVRRPDWGTFWATILVGWVVCGLPGVGVVKLLTDELSPIAYYTEPCMPGDNKDWFMGPPRPPMSRQ